MKEDDLKEISQDFQNKTSIIKEYPQGEMVSSIELSENSILDKSIMNSLDEINQIKANLNLNN